MFRSFHLCCLLACVAAYRHRSGRSKKNDAPQIDDQVDEQPTSLAQVTSSKWKTRADSSVGACAGMMRKRSLPITLILFCTGPAKNLKFSARAEGRRSPRLRMYVDGSGKGSKLWPISKATRTWDRNHGSLSAGVHNIKFTGDRLVLKRLDLQGDGASCSFQNAPGYESSSYMNTGLDVITRVVGPNRNFSADVKRNIHFAHETIGRNADGSISSTVVSNGLWQWFFEYSREQPPNDRWLVRKERDNKMYDESNIKPYLKTALDQFPGRSGQNMVVCEPCNTLSNIMFLEASVYTACKGLPFTRDETASLMAGFGALAAGSAFFHASATGMGQVADRFTMQLIMYQVHQIMVRSVIKNTGVALTNEEKNTIWFLDGRGGWATDRAKQMTSLFRTPYEHSQWEKSVRDMQFPDYTMCIVTTVLTVVESLRGNWPIPGLEPAVNAVVNALLGVLGSSDKSYVTGTFRPKLRKAFKEAKFCGDRIQYIGRFLKFIVTFVDAFLFQEQQIKTPKALRDIVKFIDTLGFSSNNLKDMNTYWDLYNTQQGMCHKRSPHATWHEKAAHGLMHIQNVASLAVTKIQRKC